MKIHPICIYYKDGNKIAFTLNRKEVFLFSGEQVAYINDDALYNIKNQHIGWIFNDKITDLAGYEIFYVGFSFEYNTFQSESLFNSMKPLKGFEMINNVFPLTPKPQHKSEPSKLSVKEFFCCEMFDNREKNI